MRITGRLGVMLVSGFVFLGFIGTASVRAETMDRIVATVNGDIILYSELQDRINLLQKLTGEVKIDTPEQRQKVEQDVLQQMVRERLTEAEIQRLKIVVSPREVDEAIEGIKLDHKFTDAQLQYMVQQGGQTMDQFRDTIKKELERSRLIDRVLKSKTVITKEQVDAYLKSGKAEGKERRRIAIIFVPGAEASGEKPAQDPEKLANDLYSRLKGGADFSKLAKEYSKGPAAEDGGDIGFISTDELAPAIEAATRKLKKDEFTDVLKSSNGFYLIKLIDVQKESLSAEDTGAREKVRRQLFNQEVNHKFEEWVRDLESRAFIKISL